MCQILTKLLAVIWLFFWYLTDPFTLMILFKDPLLLFKLPHILN